MSDGGPSWIYVSLVASNEADTLLASITLFLSFKMVAMMAWDIPEWQVLTVTDFPLL